MLDALLGLCTSAKMHPIRDLVAKVAVTNTTVLLRGESGVGKEIVAKAIHKASPRASKQFLKVNCAALPSELLESELFGHEKGAFTGAYRQKPGKFEAADQGTLLLDEIGEMPLRLQAKLLHVLQDGEFSRVGGEKIIDTDVRLICATNRDLEASMRSHQFREDLYYRINVLQITIPPLRDRKEDIPSLLDHFVARNNARFGTKIRGFEPEAKRLLLEYSWPGNVRELENTVERAMVLAERDTIFVEDLPERLREARDPIKLQLTSGELSIKKTARIIEEILIRRALQKTGGNRTRAAEVLEISHRALLYKIKDYHIEL